MAVKASVIRVKAIKGSGSKSSCIGYGSLSAAGKVIIGVLPNLGSNKLSRLFLRHNYHLSFFSC